jgi:hypothetical protein
MVVGSKVRLKTIKLTAAAILVSRGAQSLQAAVLAALAAFWGF